MDRKKEVSLGMYFLVVIIIVAIALLMGCGKTTKNYYRSTYIYNTINISSVIELCNQIEYNETVEIKELDGELSYQGIDCILTIGGN